MIEMSKLLDWLCGYAEEINGERCPTYMYRWLVFGVYSGLKLYCHHFVGNDWTRDLHDHPKRFVSIGLKGAYREQTPHGWRDYRAPWLRTFPATHIHRLILLADCWTLVLVLRPVREWGFWHDGIFSPWRAYVQGPLADKVKDC